MGPLIVFRISHHRHQFRAAAAAGTGAAASLSVSLRHNVGIRCAPWAVGFALHTRHVLCAPTRAFGNYPHSAAPIHYACTCACVRVCVCVRWPRPHLGGFRRTRPKGTEIRCAIAWRSLVLLLLLLPQQEVICFAPHRAVGRADDACFARHWRLAVFGLYTHQHRIRGPRTNIYCGIKWQTPRHLHPYASVGVDQSCRAHCESMLVEANYLYQLNKNKPSNKKLYAIQACF